ncbi:conserved hypothetical protein [Leishmania major strain Friedlin]|uniref:DUF4042 domain-containing protein n=1 Tax=Leishmania major TaxID=5664 RepID=Q4QCB5_LEIMA|nr:conserved hypothetical protein [Leishmania major strain Friedlin]CAG9573429.1 Domain_of_unknown_function_(DUF4042)/HEAT-like_repeat_-_putative [Leishmania major strain Friedlin]CAJ04374.1 conserved hypothetical protein [Leishmania major strain Friedlin]|eukprot:XP_001683033.1 conserved hypothetical protein [Leishmania major strain Friedlin]
MSTPKTSPRHRGRDGKSDNKSGGTAAGGSKPSTPSGAATAARGGGGIGFSYHPIHNLQFLKELLRPSAASRIAAAARAVHVDDNHGAAAGAACGPLPLYASALGWSGATASSLSPPPPPSYGSAVPPYQPTGKGPAPPPFAEANGATPPSTNSLAHRHLDVNALASAAPSVPSLPLVLECATQLSGMLARWRVSNEGERRRPPPPPFAPTPESSYSPPARQGNQGGAMAPTAAVCAAADAGRPLKSTPHPAGGGGTTVPPPARPSAQRILQMMDLILWYCLSTAEDAQLATGGRSRGTSGMATPAPPPGATATGAGGVSNQALGGGSSRPFGLRGGRGGRSDSVSVAGGRPGSAGRNGSGSAEPLATQDWLDGRMSSAPPTAGAPTITMSDDQLAERLFRPAVDAVVLLQGPRSQLMPSSSLPSSSLSRSQVADAASRISNSSAVAVAADTRGGLAPTPVEDATDNDAATAVELQTMALWTLAAVLVRFTDSPFNATVFLPVLFPQVDVRSLAGAAVRHPLLQPLLRGDPRNTSLLCGASAALTALLHKLRSTLQYAEEPPTGRQAAFLSLAAQCGTILTSLHESLCWGLVQSQQQQPQNAGHGTVSTTPSSAAAVPLLNTYATVVSVTPYHRCPRSREVALRTLQLPVMHSFLAHDEVGAFVPATVLVSNILKNDTMRVAAAQLPGMTETQAGQQGRSEGDETPAAGGDRAAVAASFLQAVLSHADTRVEVWRCMVPLSRLYPRLVNNEFEALMAASVKVASALTAWEAAEAAAEAAAMASVSVVAEREDDLNSQGQLSPAPSASATLSRPTQSASGGGGNNAEERGVPPPMYGEGEGAGPDAGAAPLSLQYSRAPAASLDAFAECLRTWLHYMGYVWKAFDDNASDPAQRPEGQVDRASVEHKQRIHEELLRPAMRLRRCGADVRTMTLRCIAQIGNAYMSTVADRSLCEEFVAYVQSSAADAQPRVRGEALTTLGVWLWQYTSMDDFACVAIDSAVHSLTTDPNPVVRTKAAFALSNVTGRLPEGSCAVVRNSPDYIATLCRIAMHAAVIDTESGVQGHGIRMMSHLLQVLTFEELISEVEEFEEGVAEGFLRVLLECLRANNTRGGHNTHQEGDSVGESGGTGAASLRYAVPREAKHRWNAACALGMGLSREEVFEAEPKYAVEAVEALCTAVVRDHIFKVRTQAAGALARIPGHCLSGTYTATDMTPTVVASLCKALETATSTENFRQYKEQGSLHDALRSALAVMMASTTPSNELEKVFTSHLKVLEKEGLL